MRPQSRHDLFSGTIPIFPISWEVRPDRSGWGDYKLVELYESGTLELYNLKEDISESNDLSMQMPGKTEELHRMLMDWRKKVNAQVPIPNPEYKKQVQK